MSEYIKREDALDACHEETSSKWSTKEETEEGKIIASAIMNIPSADVIPITHAKWQCYVYDESDFNTWQLRCDHCGTFYPHRYLSTSNYCPRCGAKMDRIIFDFVKEEND